MPSPSIVDIPQFPSDPDVTIDEHLKQLRREEQVRERAAVEAIKAIHAAGPTRVVADPRQSPGLIHRSPGMVWASVNGEQFTGWFREGQPRRMPSRKMPSEIDADRRWENFAMAIRAAVPKSYTMAILARRAIRARREGALAQAVPRLWRQLDQEGVRVQGRGKRIARLLNCNDEYVRRVIRDQHLKSGPTRPANSFTT